MRRYAGVWKRHEAARRQEAGAVLTKDFLKGRRRQELSADELNALEGVFTEQRTLAARTCLVRRGDQVRVSTLLIEGFMCRYMDDREGRRQLVAVHVPGDFVDLHGYPLQRLDHDLATLTACRVAIAPHERMTELTEQWPHLARLLWFSTLLDAATHREWIFRNGRLSADARIAHFLCEICAKLTAIGRVVDGSFDLPLTQQDLGEITGLTSVHVNRMLAKLKRDGLASVTNRRATVHDPAGLARLGEFYPDYLFLKDSFHTP